VKGHGLGLAYVKKIIDLHKGEIKLKSKKDFGTTFTIRIPNINIE
jgi:two-component system phosphate regulon sensor histidine kinase PhoR